MSRARNLSLLGNENSLTVDSSTFDVGVNSTSPSSDFAVGGSVNIDGTAGIITATTFKGALTGNADSATSATSATNASGLSGTPSVSVNLVTAADVNVSGSATIDGHLSVAGTITHEDVTNVDSVGIVTAGKGLRTTTGGIQVVGLYTGFSASGVSTFADALEIGVGASVFSPASNTLTLGTNDTERFRISSAGKIGVGTADPQELLSVSEGNLFISNSSTPQLRLSTDNTDASDNDRTILGQATGNDHFVNGSTSGDTVLRGNTTGDILFGVGTGEKARVTATGGISLNNGELIESCNISATALNSDTAINLDNGMVHYRSANLGAASVKPNIFSSVGINTQMGVGDAITVTIITAVNSSSNFVDHVMIDYKDVTESWIGGSAPTDGGTAGFDTYAFNIVKTASETFTVICNQIKTS